MHSHDESKRGASSRRWFSRSTKSHKKVVAVFLLVSVSLFTLAKPVQGDVGVSFNILSFGPLSVGVDMALEDALPLVAILLVGELLISFFSSESPGKTYSASYAGKPEDLPVKPVISTVTISRDGHYSGESIRIKYNSIVVDNKIALTGGAYLKVLDNGKMVFRNSPFDGWYAYIHFDHSLSVWDENGRPVLVIVPKGDKTLILQEKSPKASEVFGVLFGSPMRKSG